jgi:hypothetical protein
MSKAFFQGFGGRQNDFSELKDALFESIFLVNYANRFGHKLLSLFLVLLSLNKGNKGERKAYFFVKPLIQSSSASPDSPL